MSRRLGRALAVAALVAITLEAPANGATTPWCEAVGFSPRFATDRTMFCATLQEQDYPGFRLYRSTDRGRTWQRRGSYLPRSQPEFDIMPSAIFVDAAYPAQPTAYVLTQGGLFQADDDGARITMLSDNWFGTPSQTTPYRELAVPGVPARTAFVVAPPATLFGASVYDTMNGSPTGRTARTVVGTPSANDHFIVPPDYATTRQAVAIGHGWGVRPTGEQRGLGILNLGAFACSGDFICAQRLADFGEGTWAHDVGTIPGLTYLTIVNDRIENPQATILRAVHSRDGGRTWQDWTSVNRLMRRSDLLAHGIAAGITVVRSPDHPKRLWLRMSLPPGTAPLVRTPVEQLYRSDDDGGSWQRVGYALAPVQPGAGRGNLPYNSYGPMFHSGPYGAFHAQAGGRLYVIAGTQVSRTYSKSAKFSYAGLYCSPDSGRTWRRGGGC